MKLFQILLFILAITYIDAQNRFTGHTQNLNYRQTQQAVNQFRLEQLTQQIEEINIDNVKQNQIVFENMQFIGDVLDEQIENGIKKAFLDQVNHEKLIQIKLMDAYQKSQERLEKLQSIWNPQYPLVPKVALLADRIDDVQPIRKALLLSNDFDFKIYNVTTYNEDKDEYPDFIWRIGEIEYESDMQIAFSHLPNLMEAFHNKIPFYHNLIKYDKTSNFSIKSTNFIKRSYPIQLNSKTITDDEAELFKLEKSSTVFIEKLPKMSLGFGIFIRQDAKKLIDDIKLCKSGSSECVYKIHYKKEKFDNTTLIQEYITNPLLLDGKKFDMRTFVLMFWTGKNYLLFQSNLNIRRAHLPYDLFSDDVKNIHTTHTSAFDVYKYNETLFAEKLQDAQSSLYQFEDQFKKEYNATQDELDFMYRKQSQILTYAMLAGIKRIGNQAKKGQFHLFGCDTMWDDQRNPWLMECNKYPQILYTTPQKEVLMPKIVKSMLDIIMVFQNNWEEMHQIALNPENIPLGTFKMIYNGATKYNILNEQSSFEEFVQERKTKVEQKKNDENFQKEWNDYFKFSEEYFSYDDVAQAIDIQSAHKIMKFKIEKIQKSIEQNEQESQDQYREQAAILETIYILQDIIQTLGWENGKKVYDYKQNLIKINKEIQNKETQQTKIIDSRKTEL